AVAKAVATVGVSHEMLVHFLLEERPRRRRAGVESCLDRLVWRAVRMILALAFREVEPDVGEDLDRGIEQRDALEPVGIEDCQLEDQPAPERVSDEGRVAYTGRVERLEDVVRVRCDRPRGLPVREAVPAEGGRQDAEPLGEALFCEPAKPASVRVDAVDADDRRPRAIAPLVEVQFHHARYCPPCSRCCTTSTAASRRSTQSWTTPSVRGRTRTSWAATTAPGARIRSSVSSGSGQCRRRRGSGAMGSGGRGSPRWIARRWSRHCGSARPATEPRRVGSTRYRRGSSSTACCTSTARRCPTLRAFRPSRATTTSGCSRA